MSDLQAPVKRRSGRPKRPDFQYLGPDEQQEYRQVSLIGSPRPDEVLVGALSGWYDTGGYLCSRYQTRLTHPDWRQFSDPDRLVFRSYIAELTRHGEQVARGARQLLDGGYLDQVDASWREVLQYLSALRYLEGGASRVWQLAQTMAGSDPIHFCAVEEAGNRMMASHALNHYTLDLAEVLDGWNDDDAGLLWLEDPALAGMREYMEQELVLRDWAEIVVADGLVAPVLYLLPALRSFGINAGANGDPVTPLVISVLTAMGERRLRWATALMEMALTVPDNRPVITEWLETWGRRGLAALQGFAAVTTRPAHAPLRPSDEVSLAISRFEDVLGRLGVAAPALR